MDEADALSLLRIRQLRLTRPSDYSAVGRLDAPSHVAMLAAWATC